MASQRSGNYTTSGRSSTGKSSAIVKKAAPKGLPAPKSAPKPLQKLVNPPKSNLPSKMPVPGSARPMSPADHKLVRQRTAPSRGSKSIPAGPRSVPSTGRDRFGSKPAPKASFGRPGANRQESEAKIMSAMFRDRLGPGQR